MSDYTHTADNSVIKAQLKKAGFTRQQIAEHVGVKVQTVNNWLSAGRPIPGDKKRRLMALLQGDAAASPLEQVMAFSVRLTPAEFERVRARAGIELEGELEGVVRDLLEERWGIVSGEQK